MALLTDNFFKMLSWEVIFLLEEDYCPKPSKEIRDGYGDSYEWTKTCIFEEKDFVYQIYGQSILD